MYDPMIPEALQLFDTMVNKHARQLYKADLIWEPFKDPDQYVVQLVPRLILSFKG